ncbi:DUF1501 domain-containing protein [Methylomagnum sp.]
MKNEHSPNRRDFLKLSAGLASLGVMSMGLGLSAAFPRTARAATAGDYKALVCIYLFGGNDGNNLIVPRDAARYAKYTNIRGNLALSDSELLPAITDGVGNPYSLHYGLPELNTLFGQGKLAVVLNTGMLEQPLTRAEHLAGLKTPSNLYSHSDQTVQAQTGQPNALGTGWGGRLLDKFGVASDSLAAVSVSSPALLLQGDSVQGNVVTPGSNLSLSGMSLWPASAGTARRQAVNQMLGLDAGSPVRQAANQAMADGLALSDALKSNANLTPLTTQFPGTGIGLQLKEILRMIRLRAQQGPGRQVFFCSMDGFDTHGGQDWQHWDLLKDLSQALSAFYQAAVEVGLENNITSFTQSEFGRTLQSNGSGSDHAWGNHQIVLGGTVKGGIYGQLPDHTLNGPDDANGRGVWIPKIATAQFGATLGRWFGASDGELAAVFPNLGLNLDVFPSSDVGFMW